MTISRRFEEALIPLPVRGTDLRMSGSDKMARRVLSQYSVVQLLSRVASLPGVVSPTVVLPDLTIKSFGLPSGVTFKSRNILYPGAVPDVADGYLVVNTGWRVERRFAECAAMTFGIVEGFFNRCVSATLNDDSIRPERLRRLGECVLGHDGLLQCAHNGTAEMGVEVVEESLRGLIDEFLMQFGRLAGQYISLYVATENSPSAAEGDIILVIHAGAEILRTLMYEEVIFPLAVEASGAANINSVTLQHGLFGVPDTELLGRKFLAIADVANKVAFATRRWTAERLLGRLVAAFSNDLARPVILQHSRHVSVDASALTNAGTEYEFCRGVQRVGARFPSLFFVTGGPNTHAALMRSVDPSGVSYVAHGTSQAQLSPDEAIEILGRSQVQLSDIERRRVAMCSNFVDSVERSVVDSAYLEELIEYYQQYGLAELQTRLIPFVNFRDPEMNVGPQP